VEKAHRRQWGPPAFWQNGPLAGHSPLPHPGQQQRLHTIMRPAQSLEAGSGDIGEPEGASNHPKLVLDGSPERLWGLRIQGEELPGAHGIHGHIVAEECRPLHGVLQGVVHGALLISPGRRLQQRGHLVGPLGRYRPLQYYPPSCCRIA
jgi:hypothetical protein